MANYRNIKPYADFAHTAAQNGGVQNYLNQIANSNYRLGVMDEKSTEGNKAVFVGVAVLTIWEVGKWLFKTGRQLYQDERDRVAEEAEQAEEALLQEVENIDEKESFKAYVRKRLKKQREEVDRYEQTRNTGIYKPYGRNR